MKNTYFDEIKKNGYYILDDGLEEESLKVFQNSLNEVIENISRRSFKKDNKEESPLTENTEEKLIALLKSNNEYSPMVSRIISRCPEFYRLLSSRILFDSIRDALNKDRYSPLYLLSNGIIFTSPIDQNDQASLNINKQWHRDTFYTIPNNRFLQIWGPVFNDATIEVGTLMICPGSHNKGHGEQIYNPNESYNYRYSVPNTEVSQYEKKIIELKLGQLLVFDGNLIHASGINKSKNKMRISLLGICHDASLDTCVPVSPEYRYHGQTPEQFHYSLYKDENIKPYLNQFASEQGPPKGGI